MLNRLANPLHPATNRLLHHYIDNAEHNVNWHSAKMRKNVEAWAFN
jgi:hypothetical protein